MTFAAAKFISNVTNPVMLLLTVLAGIGIYRRNRDWKNYAAASSLAIVITYVVVHSIRDSHIIRSLPWFPSGHETFAASTGTSLVLTDRRWLILVMPTLALLGVALVRARYHVPIDILGAILISPPLTLLCHRIRIGKARSTT